MTTNDFVTIQPNRQQMAFVLPLYEAETQLRHLVKQTQTKHQPIIFTSGEDAQPLAILIEPSLFERLQRQERQIFHLQLQRLLSLLDSIRENLYDEDRKDRFIQEFVASIGALSDVCPQWQRSTYITLKMSSKRLSSKRLTDTQINALYDCVKLLRNGLLDEEQIKMNRQKLIECGLPPMMAGNDSIMKMYVDIL